MYGLKDSEYLRSREILPVGKGEELNVLRKLKNNGRSACSIFTFLNKRGYQLSIFCYTNHCVSQKDGSMAVFLLTRSCS